MPTTQHPRINRPDGRAVSAQRKRKMGQKLSVKEDISDLRITRVQKQDKKEREASGDVGNPKSKSEKKIRALKKKLREIETLLSTKEESEMTEGQQQKIECLDTVIEELEELSASQAKANFRSK